MLCGISGELETFLSVKVTQRDRHTALNLHESHSSHEDQQRDPLVDAQPAAKHRDGEEGRGQNLQLVRHLVETQRQIATTEVVLLAEWLRGPNRLLSVEPSMMLLLIIKPFSAVPGMWLRPGWTRPDRAGCSAGCRSPRGWPASAFRWVCWGFPDVGCC